jgi:hypothetical protein
MLNDQLANALCCVNSLENALEIVQDNELRTTTLVFTI